MNDGSDDCVMMCEWRFDGGARLRLAFSAMFGVPTGFHRVVMKVTTRVR